MNQITQITKIEGNNIIEVGPGMGFLTDEILKSKPKKLMGEVFTSIEENKTFIKLSL